MKNLIKTLILSFLFVFAFGAAKPAKAFYLEVPASVKDLLAMFKSHHVYAETAPTMMTPPPGMTMPTQDMMQQYQNQMPTQGMMPPSGDQYKQYQGTQNMPENYDPSQSMQGNTQGMMQKYQGMPSGDQGQGMQSGKEMGQNPQDSAKQLAQMKRGMKQMASQVKQFDLMIAKAEKKGTAVPEEVKQNLAKLKSILDSVTNATSMEELQDVDMSEMQELMQSLEDFRRNVMEMQQRMDGMKQGMKGMETGLKMFEKQIAMLTKKGVTVPADIADHITKLRTIIDAVKNAKTSNDLESLDLESMPDLMESFNQDRQQLEVLARWPQTLKQIDRQLSQLTRELAKSKSIVDRLAKKGLDLQIQYTAFADAVNKLKSVRDDAVAKMAAGNSEEAFSALEDDFFGQMDDVWQYQRVIMTMSNLGRFASEFKQGIAQANSVVRNLKRKKLDTSDLEALVAQAKDKGQEILNLLKAGNIDEDTVIAALDELENIKQEFESKVSELTGQEEALPWEQGPQQFRRVELPQGFDKFIPQKQESQTQQPTQSEPIILQAQ